MINTIEAGEEHLAFVDGGIEFQISVNVGVNDECRSAGDVNFIVDDGDAERGEEGFLLHEDVALVGLAVAIGVLEDHNAIAGGVFAFVAAVVVRLGYPDAAVGIDVHIGRVAEVGGLRPEGDFEAVGHGQHIQGDVGCGRVDGQGGRALFLGRRRFRLGSGVGGGGFLSGLGRQREAGEGEERDRDNRKEPGGSGVGTHWRKDKTSETAQGNGGF